MRKEFLHFLATAGVIPAERAARFQETLRAAPEPIGAIAFRYGMITGGDIDEILDEQRHSDRPFGEIAIDKGLLTPRQVDNLLRVQQVRAAMEAAEALVLSGVCPFERVATHLGQFLTSLQGSLVGAR